MSADLPKGEEAAPTGFVPGDSETDAAADVVKITLNAILRRLWRTEVLPDYALPAVRRFMVEAFAAGRREGQVEMRGRAEVEARKATQKHVLFELRVLAGVIADLEIKP